MAGERVVDFYYSIGSRYSYLASTQIAKLEGETGCQVRWHPVNGLDIRKLRGRDPFAGEPLSGQYEWPYRRYDAECWADYYGVPFREPLSPHFDYPSGRGQSFMSGEWAVAVAARPRRPRTSSARRASRLTGRAARL